MFIFKDGSNLLHQIFYEGVPSLSDTKNAEKEVQEMFPGVEYKILVYMRMDKHV